MRPAVHSCPEPAFQRTPGLLRDLTVLSSDSGDPAGFRRAAERLAAALRENGLATEIREESPGEGARGADTAWGAISC
jgi:hypothetical protein